MQFEAPTDGRFVFALNPAGTTFEAGLEVRTSCNPGTAIDCTDPFLGGAVSADMQAGDVVYLSVDGLFFGEQGDFQIDVSEVASDQTSCGDQIDNDLDGMIDCFDDDCEQDAACADNCPDTQVTGPLPALVNGDLAGRPDHIDSSCGDGARATRNAGETVIVGIEADFDIGFPPSIGFDRHGATLLYAGEQPEDVVDFWR